MVEYQAISSKRDEVEMSSREEQNDVYESSSESEREGERPSDHKERREEGGGITRAIQVVSTAPSTREGTGSEEGAERRDNGSSSSEYENEAGEIEVPSRGKSYLQSIRARKPKKKIIYSVSSHQFTDKGTARVQSKDNTNVCTTYAII